MNLVKMQIMVKKTLKVNYFSLLNYVKINIYVSSLFFLNNNFIYVILILLNLKNYIISKYG